MALQWQPLSQSLDAFLLDLYRHWYALPPRSAREPIEAQRSRLAERLSAGVDARPAIRAFVDDIVRRPKVMVSTTATLRALRTSLDQEALAQLRSEQLPPLISRLRMPAPAETTIRAMVFIPARAELTLSQIMAALDAVQSRIPPPDQEAIDDILEELHAELGVINAAFAPGTPEILRAARRQGPTVEALERLEALDIVIRAAWQALLAGKVESAEQIPATLGGGSFPIPKGASPPLEEGNEELFESAVGIDEVEDINQLEDRALGHVQGRGAPSDPVERTLHTDVTFPAQVKRGDEAELTIRLTQIAQSGSRAVGEVIVEFIEPDKPQLIEVVVSAPGFSERYELWHRSMVVYSDRDSEPVTLFLTAQEPLGARTLSIAFYRDGKHLAKAEFRAEIVDTATRGRIRDGADAAPAVALSALPLPPPADLELRVTHDKQTNELHFLLHSTKAAVPFHWTYVDMVALHDVPPEEHFKRHMARLNDLSSWQADELSTEELAEFEDAIRRIGEQLFEELFPEKLQSLYWSHIQRLRRQGVITSLLITTDEPWIPWELVKPYALDDIDGSEHEDGYLGEEFEFCRWLAGSGPNDMITVERASLVVPDSDLDFAGSEGEYVQSLVSRGVQIGIALKSKSDVLQQIRDGGIQLLHFASHADYSADDPDASPIILSDDDLLPADLGLRDVRKLRAARPLVFLNACNSAKMGFKPTGMGGWARKWVEDVQVTAFIGTHWEVNDFLAGEFAKHFYAGLLQEMTLGAAFRAARLHVHQLAPANPTWLAYTLYGDPNTRISWGM